MNRKRQKKVCGEAGMTVRAATTDFSSEDSSSSDASDVSGGDDIADHTESQPVLFNSEEGDVVSGTYEMEKSYRRV